MARKNSLGRYVLSAGEIGSYTVCPEAWRLRMVSRVKSLDAESKHRGADLHRAWAKLYEDSVYLSRGVRLVVALTLLLVLVTFLF
jgi:hypothetical protein